jgi:hypothetical protein
MRMGKLTGQARVTAACLGLALGMSVYSVYRVMGGQDRPTPVVYNGPVLTVVVALRDMPAQTVLNSADPELTTRDVKGTFVKSDDLVPGALRDISIGEEVRLLSDVKAGQQITNYSLHRS